jgi:hypothetical protein
MNAEKRIYAKFAGPPIFQEQGRLLYALLRIFTQGGYRITLFNYLGDKPLEKYGQMIHSLEGLELTEAPPAAPEDGYLLYDEADGALTRLPWRKLIQVRFDLFSPFWFSDPIIIPYPMHPLHSGTSSEKLEDYRSMERKVRVFFSGDTENYHRVRIFYPEPKLPRQKIIDTIKARLGNDLVLVQDAEELSELHRAPYTNKCILTASHTVRIDFPDWLPTLARADFFLSPPGIIMPMCHNITEAMAVGAIPITNYPEWMDPPLRHMHDCLVFGDEDDLIAKLRQALAMAPDEIARLRTNVLNYYRAYLRPEIFLERVEAHEDRKLPILMHTENNVWHNSKRLGRYAILLQGTTPQRPRGWLRRMVACHRRRDTP